MFSRFADRQQRRRNTPADEQTAYRLADIFKENRQLRRELRVQAEVMSAVYDLWDARRTDEDDSTDVDAVIKAYDKYQDDTTVIGRVDAEDSE